ncbi:hypothetical protein [Hyphomicrobium sulfonivorans]|uniref:hypothetical protein n=1 Tax=Hyphomicrobium sulfonivorans TaxID=121290 RepID=UPI0015700343|nr:hypothetical protein [Hyphomicrobium sulfonivorans]MBI1649153.1 hypothetical protein [Hyphomicrobium sulfonivorans]
MSEAIVKRMMWFLFLVAASIVATTVFACAFPFAAVAALAALDTEYEDGAWLVGASWLANQAYGFGVLGYPLELQAFGWGLFMGAGAIAGYYAARAIVLALKPYGMIAMLAAALPVAFLVYQAGIYAGTLVLTHGEGAFLYDVVQYVATVEVIAFAVLLVVHRIAFAAGFVTPNAIERA